MDDIKHDPDPLLTSMMNLMWRYDKDPSADALVNVLNEAAAEIERLRAEIVSVRAERDCAQIQADHLSQRLIRRPAVDDIVKHAFYCRDWMLPVVVIPPVVSLFLVNWKIGIVWIAYVLVSVRRG